jgi:hypothetical protein
MPSHTAIAAAPRTALRCVVFAGAILVACGLFAGRGAQAQTWCAEYNDGTQECGIPSEQSCRESVSGVGGLCEPDDDKRKARGPRLLQRLFDPAAPQASPNNLPMSDPQDMPPPPVR